jgi:hypothetical protein
MTLRTFIAASLLATFAVSAFAHNDAHGPAQHNTPRVDERQAHQHQRINQGAASGALTSHEAHCLGHEQRAIRRAEVHAKADGVVTAQERHHLHHMQHRASRHIAHEKHDAQMRRW